MDFRFQTTIRDYLVANGFVEDFDLVSYAGSSKNLETVITQIVLSNKLHGATNIHIFHHEECGAYGLDKTTISNNEEIAIHKADMQKAKATIENLIINAKVNLYFVSLDKAVTKLD